MREFTLDNSTLREELADQLREIVEKLENIPNNLSLVCSVVTVGDIRSLIQNIPDEVTVWVHTGGVAVPIRDLEISDCTMPDGTHEEQSLSLTISEEDVAELS